MSVFNLKKYDKSQNIMPPRISKGRYLDWWHMLISIVVGFLVIEKGIKLLGYFRATRLALTVAGAQVIIVVRN